MYASDMKCVMRAPSCRHSPIGRRWIANESRREIKKRKVFRNWAVVGIDLGTTNSAVAWAGPDGLQVIEHEDGDGGRRKYIPSVVGVTEDAQYLVGWDALRTCGGLKNTFYSFKQLLGRQLKDIDASVVDRLMYPLFSTNSGFAAVQCPQTGDLMTPEQLSMLVLGHLIANTEQQIEDVITGAVVTVPAMASSDQRSATLAATKYAGIDVVHLLQEPVAAALAYGINGGTDGDTVLVMDVGGGTFDVSILQAFEGILEVLGTSGDQNLGGDDIDALVADWIVRELVKKGLDMSAMDESWAPHAARKAKEAFSVSESAAVEIRLPGDFPCKEATIGMQLTLTEDTFNELMLPLFQRMAIVLEKLGYEYHVEWAISPSSVAMEICNVKNLAVNDKSGKSQNKVPVPPSPWAPPPRRITKVALVGQTTFIPSIRRFAKVLTGIEPSQGVDPSEAVALGAAIHAGILVGSLDTCELMDGSFNATLHSRVTGFTEWQP